MFDCSKDELSKLDWSIRSWWIGQLGIAAEADGWFRNIQGIIAFFATTPELSDLEGWASYADAGLLWAIQDGYRTTFRLGYKTQSFAGSLWADFFDSFMYQSLEGPSPQSLWGQAELAGTELGKNYATYQRNTPIPQNLEGDILNEFIEIGDGYRETLAYGSCVVHCNYQLAYEAIEVVEYGFQVDLTSPRTPWGVLLGAEYARVKVTLQNLRLLP